MSDREREVYSKRVRDRLDKLVAAKHAAEDKVRAIARRIEELLAGQSPIGPGAVIVWASGPRERRGRVVSVRTGYRGYEYRCDILTKQGGRVIGQAWVSESDHPALEVT